MSSTVHSAIDEILEQAVESGAVPNVVAIAADRDGLIYEGAAGPRVVGESGDVTAGTRFRIMSMTKMVATPGCRCSSASTATGRSCARRRPGRRSSS
jgi:CubicO group peptidase (beta-lactamase class C family)